MEVENIKMEAIETWYLIIVLIALFLSGILIAKWMGFFNENEPEWNQAKGLNKVLLMIISGVISIPLLFIGTFIDRMIDPCIDAYIEKKCKNN